MREHERKQVFIVSNSDAVKIAEAMKALGEYKLAKQFSDPEPVEIFVSRYENQYGSSFDAFIDIADLETDRQNLALDNYDEAFDGDEDDPPHEDRAQTADAFFEKMSEGSHGFYYDFAPVTLKTFVEPAPLTNPSPDFPEP